MRLRLVVNIKCIEAKIDRVVDLKFDWCLRGAEFEHLSSHSCAIGTGSNRCWCTNHNECFANHWNQWISKLDEPENAWTSIIVYDFLQTGIHWFAKFQLFLIDLFNFNDFWLEFAKQCTPICEIPNFFVEFGIWTLPAPISHSRLMLETQFG